MSLGLKTVPRSFTMAIEELELQEGGPTQYTVAQGVCFLKPDEAISINK